MVQGSKHRTIFQVRDWRDPRARKDMMVMSCINGSLVLKAWEVTCSVVLVHSNFLQSIRYIIIQTIARQCQGNGHAVPVSYGI